MARIIKLDGRCVSCKHRWTMTPQEQKDAKRDGMATCPKCMSPATIERASIRGRL